MPATETAAAFRAPSITSNVLPLEAVGRAFAVPLTMTEGANIHSPVMLPALDIAGRAQTPATPPTFRAAPPQIDVPASCPTTKPPSPAFVPPLPWPAAPSSDGRAFWFGTSQLWTELLSGGTWTLREFSESDPTFRQKSPWWREGYNTPHEPEPDLTITGERVDAPAPPIRTLPANSTWEPSKPDQSFLMTGFNLPTLGCWRITGHYKDVSVTYVVWVTR